VNWTSPVAIGRLPPIRTPPAVASSRSPETRVAKNRRACIASNTAARVFSTTQSPLRPLPSGKPQSVPCSSEAPVSPVRQPAFRQATSGDDRPSDQPSNR